jgi:hypothetical protein
MLAKLPVGARMEALTVQTALDNDWEPQSRLDLAVELV